MTEPWKRREVIGNATLYLGDCLEILPTLPKVDAVITDPPYGIDFVQRTTGERITGDASAFDVSFIVALGVPSVVWGENYMSSSHIPTGGRLIWLKRAVEQAAQKSYSDAEIAWTNATNQVRVYRQISDGCIREGEEHGIVRLHPSQKPAALMRWCIEFVKGAHSVIDPFMGSGTTGVACMNLGRNFIGIEIEPRYFDIACERITNAQRQQRMFE